MLSGDPDLGTGKFLLKVSKAIYGMVQCSLEWSNTLAKVLGTFRHEGHKLKRLMTDRCMCVGVWRNDKRKNFDTRHSLRRHKIGY